MEICLFAYPIEPVRDLSFVALNNTIGNIHLTVYEIGHCKLMCSLSLHHFLLGTLIRMRRESFILILLWSRIYDNRLFDGNQLQR